MTDSDIIDALGGPAALAKLFGLSVAAVSYWKTRGISWEYRPRIAALAQERQVELPPDFLLTKRKAA